MGALKQAWVATKGGDGGVAPKLRLVGQTHEYFTKLHALDNLRVFTHGDDPSRPLPKEMREAFTETKDAADRAHRRKGAEDKFLPAARRDGTPAPIAGATPRKYHESYITSQGHTFESAFDELYERQCRLDGIDGIGIIGFDPYSQVGVMEDRHTTVEAAVMVASAVGTRKARDVLRKRTSH